MLIKANVIAWRLPCFILGSGHFVKNRFAAYPRGRAAPVFHGDLYKMSSDRKKPRGFLVSNGSVISTPPVCRAGCSKGTAKGLSSGRYFFVSLGSRTITFFRLYELEMAQPRAFLACPFYDKDRTG